MAHSDDKGLVLPPKLAPYQMVIVPIYKTPEEYEATRGLSHDLASKLRKAGIEVGGKKADLDFVLDRKGTVKTVQNNPMYAGMVENLVRK